MGIVITLPVEVGTANSRDARAITVTSEMRYRGRFNGHDYLGDWTEELMSRREAHGVER
jgi:hypothetical protein